MCLCTFAEKLCMFTNRCKLNTLQNATKIYSMFVYRFSENILFCSKQLEQTLYTNTHTASVPITKKLSDSFAALSDSLKQPHSLSDSFAAFVDVHMHLWHHKWLHL